MTPLELVNRLSQNMQVFENKVARLRDLISRLEPTIPSINDFISRYLDILAIVLRTFKKEVEQGAEIDLQCIPINIGNKLNLIIIDGRIAFEFNSKVIRIRSDKVLLPRNNEFYVLTEIPDKFKLSSEELWRYFEDWVVTTESERIYVIGIPKQRLSLQAIGATSREIAVRLLTVIASLNLVLNLDRILDIARLPGLQESSTTRQAIVEPTNDLFDKLYMISLKLV